MVVTPAPLTIMANSTNKVYNTTLNLGTTAFTSIGLQNSETIGGVTLTSFGMPANAPVGSYAIAATNAAGGTFNPANYSIVYSNGTLTVTSGIYNVGWTNPASIVYGTLLSSLQNNATSSVGGSFVYSPTNGTILPVGTNLLTTVFTPSDTNYFSTNLSVLLVVTPAPLTITANSTNKIYNNILNLDTTAFTSIGLQNGETIGGVTLSSLGTPANAPVGSYVITATNAVGGTFNSANYSIVYSNGTLTVTAGIYTAGWTNPASIVYGTALSSLQNNATSSIAGSFVYSPTNGTILPVGTNVLTTVFTPGDTNYASTNLSVFLVVMPAPLTITANSTNKVYNTTLNLGTTAFTSIGLQNSETIGGVTLSSAGTPANAPVGSYAITATNAVGGTFNPANYNIAYSNGTLTVTTGIYNVGWTNPASIVYGTALSSLQNDATSSIGGSFVYSPTNGTILPVGTNLLTTVFTPTNTNYTSTNLSVLLVVTPAPLIITANSTNKIYGTLLNLGTNAFASVGLKNSETIGGVTLSSAGTPTNAPVGSYAITATNAVGGTFNPTNYSITYNNGTLTVTRGVYSITWTNPASIVYGTALSSLQNDATSTVAGSYVYNPTNGAVLPVRTNALTVVFTPADTNYAATNLSVLQVVTPAPLTVTANSTNRIYGTANPVFTATYSGFVNGENTGVLAGNPSLSTPATAGSPVGNYTIVVKNGTLTATNYAFQFVNSTLTVNPLPAILYGVRAYDGTTNVAAGILQVTNKVGADVVTVVSGTGGLSTTNVGTWPITSFGTLTLGGASVTNYTLVGASGWVTITNTTPVTNRADLVVSVTGPAKVTVGDTFFYTVTVSNAGPTSALNIQVTNFMPTNLVFYSASGGGGLTNKVVRWPMISSLLNGDATNFIVTVYSTNGVTTNVPTGNPYNFIQTNLAPVIGLLTNRASAFASTFDPNTTNNSASVVYTNAQVNTLIVPGILSIFIATNTYPTNVSPNYTVTPSKTGVFIVGSNAFNPQTGLYEENVSVTNIGTVAIHSLRLYVTGLRKGVTLYNPTGTNNGQVYVEYVAPYSAPINPYPNTNNYVSFQLEFYATDFNPFTNTLSAVASSVVSVGGVTGTPVSGNVQKITDTRFQTDRFLLEFNSVPGKTYTILYGDAVNTITNIAVPSIVAYANVTQWYDDGPPKTSSKPASVGARFYIVIENN
jgi:hypothetical protein